MAHFAKCAALNNLAQDPKWARQRRALERELEKQSKAAGPDSMPVDGGIVNVLPKF